MPTYQYKYRVDKYFNIQSWRNLHKDYYSKNPKRVELVHKIRISKESNNGGYKSVKDVQKELITRAKLSNRYGKTVFKANGGIVESDKMVYYGFRFVYYVKYESL